MDDKTVKEIEELFKDGKFGEAEDRLKALVSVAPKDRQAQMLLSWMETLWMEYADDELNFEEEENRKILDRGSVLIHEDSAPSQCQIHVIMTDSVICKYLVNPEDVEMQIRRKRWEHESQKRREKWEDEWWKTWTVTLMSILAESSKERTFWQKYRRWINYSAVAALVVGGVGGGCWMVSNAVRDTMETMRTATTKYGGPEQMPHTIHENHKNHEKAQQHHDKITSTEMTK